MIKVTKNDTKFWGISYFVNWKIRKIPNQRFRNIGIIGHNEI